MNLLALQQDVYDRTGASQTPPTEVSRRITRYLNTWNRKVLSAPGMESLRRITLAQSSVINQPTYGIALQSIRYFSEVTTQRRLYRQTLGWYRDRFPKPLQFSSTPEWYVEMGITRIATLPTVPCQLFAVSDNGGDAGTVNAQVVRTNGFRATISVALTGLVPVAISALTDVIDVKDVSLSAVQLGNVTITQGSGGAVLSTIPIGTTFQRFLQYALVPTPSQAIVYTIDGIAEISDLANPTDEPFPNPDFHDILVSGAVYEEWMMRGRVQDAARLMHGGIPLKPTPESIQGRLRSLRATILEWAEQPDARRARTFDETIKEPIL